MCNTGAHLSIPKHQRGNLNSLRPSDAYMREWTNHHWFRLWLIAWSAPSHYLNPWWNIVNCTLRSKLKWNFIRNSNIFIQQNALENVVCEMVSILSRPKCVNALQSCYRGCCHILLFTTNDDVIKWKRFPRYWPVVRGSHRTRWIPRTQASDEGLWCFLWSASE